MTRKIIFGTYDTAVSGLWTLTGWELSAAEAESNLVEVPGRKKGPLDLSRVLTDGEPIYGARELTVTLESSEGTRLQREERINTMINWLDGWTMDIQLPDDDGHYVTGRVHVAKEYNDPAHAAVTVTAVCEPWRYFKIAREINLTAATEEATATLTNSGRMFLVPLLTITGTDAQVLVVYGNASWSLGAGSYALPDMVLQPGNNVVKFSGSGALKFSYREAVL